MLKIKNLMKKPVKALVYGVFKSSGRNNTGKITVYYRGGGHKRRFRVIDFARKVWGVIGVIVRVEYDPNRSARLALIFYKNGLFSYILCPDGVREGRFVEAGNSPKALQIGNCLQLKFIHLGLLIHNVEISFGRGGQLVRAAGSFAKILKKRLNYVLVRLSSGEERFILADGLASLGRVSNTEHHLRDLEKAGRARWLGWRPRTRAVAMNPVDHPLGGRTKGGKVPVSAWGKVIGVKTGKVFNKYIVKKRKVKKSK